MNRTRDLLLAGTMIPVLIGATPGSATVATAQTGWEMAQAAPSEDPRKHPAEGARPQAAPAAPRPQAAPPPPAPRPQAAPPAPRSEAAPPAPRQQIPPPTPRLQAAPPPAVQEPVQRAQPPVPRPMAPQPPRPAVVAPQPAPPVARPPIPATLAPAPVAPRPAVRAVTPQVPAEGGQPRPPAAAPAQPPRAAPVTPSEGQTIHAPGTPTGPAATGTPPVQGRPPGQPLTPAPVAPQQRPPGQPLPTPGVGGVQTPPRPPGQPLPLPPAAGQPPRPLGQPLPGQPLPTPPAAGQPPQAPRIPGQPLPPQPLPGAPGVRPLPGQPGGPLPGQPGGPPPPPPGTPNAAPPRQGNAGGALAVGAAAGFVGGFLAAQGVDRLQQVQQQRQRFDDNGATIYREPGRTIIEDPGNQYFIAHDENERFRDLGYDVRTERRGDEYVASYAAPDGSQITTFTDDNGRLLRRIRRFPDGRQIVLIDNGPPGPPRPVEEDVIVLPPPPLAIPQDRYIVDADQADEGVIYDTLIAPPVAPITQRYTLNQVRYSPDLRARMRSVDVDTVNFPTGSWTVTPDQAGRLSAIAQAIGKAIQRNPQEIFLVEGFTDAVGSPVDNLSLSDRRAQSVATILTQQFQVPPENLTTQGYGSQYLKVQTQTAEQANRRVVVQRITPLLSGSAQ